MESVLSPDGTRIACRVAGRGRPLVLVHGTGDTHIRWLPVLPELESRFRVYAMDRRGHGESGDTAPYAFEREFEDVAAVMGAAARECGTAAAVLGHSYGAICALEACLIIKGVSRLVLYEPPVPVPEDPIHAEALLGSLQELLARGDLDGIWEGFLRHVMKMSDREIADSRSSPTWKAHAELARVLPREAEARMRYRFDPARFTPWSIPTLLIQGSLSPRFLRSAVDMLHAALAGSRVALLRGQGHVAMASAPEEFVQAVVGVLGE